MIVAAVLQCFVEVALYVESVLMGVRGVFVYAERTMCLRIFDFGCSFTVFYRSSVVRRNRVGGGTGPFSSMLFG